MTADLLSSAERAGVDPQRVRALCDWILPHFARADLLATRYQSRFTNSGTLLLALAAGAVVVAAGANLLLVPPLEYAHSPLLTVVELGAGLIEVAFLLAIVGIIVIGRRLNWHGQWLAYRFLAERLRSRLFLALVVPPADATSNAQGQMSHGVEEWISRRIDRIWQARPTMAADQPLDSLKRFLASAWVGDQARYQERTRHRNEQKHTMLGQITLALFWITVAAALLHLASVLGGHGVLGESAFLASLGKPTLFLAIALPAVAGALEAIRNQREYERIASRAEQMEHALGHVSERLDQASDMGALRAAAVEAEDVLLEENGDWLVLTRARGYEWHV